MKRMIEKCSEIRISSNWWLYVFEKEERIVVKLWRLDSSKVCDLLIVERIPVLCEYRHLKLEHPTGDLDEDGESSLHPQLEDWNSWLSEDMFSKILMRVSLLSVNMNRMIAVTMPSSVFRESVDGDRCKVARQSSDPTIVGQLAPCHDNKYSERCHANRYPVIQLSVSRVHRRTNRGRLDVWSKLFLSVVFVCF